MLDENTPEHIDGLPPWYKNRPESVFGEVDERIEGKPIKFHGSVFGYDAMRKSGGTIMMLESSTGKPRLWRNMPAIVRGDSRGYVPSGHADGAKVIIVCFREPDTNGSTDHIVRVSDGKNEGWVKPSNIEVPIASGEK